MKEKSSAKNKMQHYQQQFKKRNILRWTTLLFYLIITFTISSLPLFINIADITYLTITIPIIFGGLIIVFAVLLYPTKNKLSLPAIPDGKIVKQTSKNNIPETYYEENKQKIAYLIIPTLIIIFAILLYFMTPLSGLTWAIGLILVTTALLIALLIFGKVELIVNKEYIKTKFGPATETISLMNIKTIRSTAIHPMKDFMGYGLRYSPDGAKGFIASGNTGIRIETKNGENIVITAKNPQLICDIVRKNK